MVNIQYILNIYKSVKISIGTVMKNPEMLKMKKENFSVGKCC